MVIEYFAEYLVETSVQQIEPAFLSVQDSIPVYHVHILEDETPQPLLNNLEISGHSGRSLSRPQSDWYLMQGAGKLNGKKRSASLRPQNL